MSAVAETLGVARSNLAERAAGRPSQRRGRPPLPETKMVEAIKSIIATMPTYGYRRVWAVLRRIAEAEGRPAPNHKRVYRVMRLHGLLLERHVGGIERRHDGRIAVERSNLRWCSDGFEIGCWNGDLIRIAFIIDAHNREIIAWHAVVGSGISGGMVRDMMLEAVESRFGALQSPAPLEWLTDNGSAYTAKETRDFAVALNLIACFTPVQSPESNSISESFVKTFKRDYVRVSPMPDAVTALGKIAGWFEDYNENHPHSGLKMRSPRSSSGHKLNSRLSGQIGGNSTYMIGFRR